MATPLYTHDGDPPPRARWRSPHFRCQELVSYNCVVHKTPTALRVGMACQLLEYKYYQLHGNTARPNGEHGDIKAYSRR